MAELTIADQYKELLVKAAECRLEYHDLDYANNEGGKSGKEYAEFLTERTRLKSQVSEVENTSAEDSENYGASIGLDKSQEIFLKGINTNGEWKEYTLYLNTLTNDQAVENYNLNLTLD